MDFFSIVLKGEVCKDSINSFQSCKALLEKETQLIAKLLDAADQ